LFPKINRAIDTNSNIYQYCNIFSKYEKNEWTEGNHLEPDMKWGKAYLEEVRRIINK
jgi:hypothetical protein